MGCGDRLSVLCVSFCDYKDSVLVLYVYLLIKIDIRWHSWIFFVFFFFTLSWIVV